MTDHSGPQSEQAPENLEQVALDGDGFYGPMQPVWGERLAHLTCRVSPETERTGAVFFKRGDYHRDDFLALCRLLGIGQETYYIVYCREAEAPLNDAYLTQWRLVTEFAWCEYFQRDEGDCEEQPLPLPEAMANLIEHECERQNEGVVATRMSVLSGGALADMGEFGLGFGLVVENAYYGIYRLWSRAVFYSK